MAATKIELHDYVAAAVSDDTARPVKFVFRISR